MEFLLTEYGNSRNVTTTVALIDDCLEIDFDVSGLRPVSWPVGDGVATRQDELWRTTCMELFIGVAGAHDYFELNLSPSFAWNCYHFNSYREGMSPADDFELLEILINDPASRLKARFSCPSLADVMTIAPCFIADMSGSLHYFAPGHGHQPDFHDRSLHVLVHRDDL